MPAFSVYPSAAVSSAAPSVFTQIPLNTVEYDTATAFDTTRYSFLPAVAGHCQITLHVTINMTGNNGFTLQTAIRKNGTAVKQSAQLINCPYGFSQTIEVNAIVDLNGTTDYLDAAFQTNSGTANVMAGGASSWMSGFYLGP